MGNWSLWFDNQYATDQANVPHKYNSSKRAFCDETKWKKKGIVAELLFLQYWKDFKRIALNWRNLSFIEPRPIKLYLKFMISLSLNN